MTHGETFLTGRDRDSFEAAAAEGSFLRRSIVERPSLRCLEGEAGSVTRLDSVIESLQQKVGGEGSWFECFCVIVTEGDGMSWSAEALNDHDAFAERLAHFERVRLAPYKTTSQLPLIADLVGRREFLKLSSGFAFETSFFTLRPWVTWVLLGAAVLLAFGLKLSEAMLTVETQATRPGGKLPYVLVGAVALLGILLQHLLALRSTQPESEKVKGFAEELQRLEGTENETYLNFVEALAAGFKPEGRPRVVIVDDYEALDRTTRLVIERYFEKCSQKTPRDTSEGWVIFEQKDSEEFSRRAFVNTSYHGYAQTRLFEQLLLTDEEKGVLVAKRPGLTESATELLTVKQICEPQLEGVKEFVQRFTDHRRVVKKGAEVGDLEFLYFLSLTTLPDGPALNRRDLPAELKRGDVLRRQVFTEILPERWSREELRARVEELEKRFGTSLRREGSGAARRLRVKREAARALAEHQEELELPDPERGHLYWSLYWFDKLQNHPTEAFWMNKLAFHLKQARLSSLEGRKTAEAVAPRLFDALLHTTDGYLKTCLFNGEQVRDLRALLGKCFDLLDEQGMGTPSQIKRLLKKCWEAYSVLGDDAILEVILDLYPLARDGAAAGEERGHRRLERLFFDAMPLPPESRAKLDDDFLVWAGGARGAGGSVGDYARARATWLALSITPISPYLSMADMSGALSAGIEVLDPLTRAAWERVKNQLRAAPPSGAAAPSAADEEGVHMADILTLSLALWCNALSFGPAALWVREQRLGTDPTGDFSKLIRESAENTVLLAGEVQKSIVARARQGADFLSTALARELYAVTLASILTSYSYLRRAGCEEFDEHLVADVNGLLEFSAEFVGYPLPPIRRVADLGSPALVKKVDALLKFCGIIWDKFNLRQLRDYVNIRRIHFNAICRAPGTGGDINLQQLLSSVGTAIQEPDFVGLMANIVVADCLRTAGELEVRYLSSAALMAIEGSFGEGLKRELSLLVITEGHAFGGDMGKYVAPLVAEDNGGGCYLARFLKALPREQVVGHIIELLNIRKNLADEEAGETLGGALDEFITQIPWKNEKKEAQLLQETFRLEGKLRAKEQIETNRLLEEWKGHRHTWLYPRVLQLLIDHGQSSPRIESEALSVLDRDPQKDAVNTYFHLASSLARKGPDEGPHNGRAKLPYRYLRDSIGRWQSALKIENNINVYRALVRWAEDEEERNLYRFNLASWQTKKMYRDVLGRLPDMMRQGRYFLIFSEHCFTMLDWGLTFDVGADILLANLQISDAERVERARSWKVGGARTPPPLAGRRISGKFLWLGTHIFWGSNGDNESYKEERQRFNELAAEAMPQLMDMILGLEKLPKSMRDLLRFYSDKMGTYTTPKD